MDDAKKVEPEIFADAGKRAGAFSDYMVVKSVNGKAILDFCLIDDMADGRATGALVSRVILTNESLVSLSDMLNKHIKMIGLRGETNA
jgi:hypothetical protein